VSRKFLLLLLVAFLFGIAQAAFRLRDCASGTCPVNLLEPGGQAVNGP
jgi:hypothetical protein